MPSEPLSVLGEFLTRRVSIQIDPKLDSSLISYDYILLHDVPLPEGISCTTDGENHVLTRFVDGSIIVPSENGYFVSSMEFRIHDLPPEYIIALGKDWIDACKARLGRTELHDILPEDVFNLSNGHSWVSGSPQTWNASSSNSAVTHEDELRRSRHIAADIFANIEYPPQDNVSAAESETRGISLSPFCIHHIMLTRNMEKLTKTTITLFTTTPLLCDAGLLILSAVPSRRPRL